VGRYGLPPCSRVLLSCCALFSDGAGDAFTLLTTELGNADWRSLHANLEDLPHPRQHQ
jgi:hypothetical protein